MSELNVFQSLLNQASALRRTQEKIALLSGENFNVFRILGLETKEVRMHSAFLGELLNPAGSHGLRDTFLKLFTQAIDFKDFKTDTARLVIEYDIGRITSDYEEGGRIDIYLESAGQYIFIENKIYANDQRNQLARYYAHRNEARLIYLTLDGAEPTKWGSGKLQPGQYQLLSYQQNITEWLEKCCQVAAAFPLVRETVVQYQHLINYLTGHTPNDYIRMEMQQIVRQSENNFVSAGALKQAFEESHTAFVEQLNEKFEEAWQERYSENLSPLPEYAIYFVRLNNCYGFRAKKNGEWISINQEEGLSSVAALSLALPKFKRDANWLGWKYMDNIYFNNLAISELYRGATDETARYRLFDDRLREADFYFDKFKELMVTLRVGA